MSVTVRGRLPTVARPDVDQPTAKPPSRAARMLALAYHIDELAESGQLRQSEAAARLGLSRARLTQVMNLLNLSAEIQSEILEGSLDLSERRLRAVAAVPEWAEQGRRLQSQPAARDMPPLRKPDRRSGTRPDHS